MFAAGVAAAQEGQPKITYDGHIKAIFRQHCLKCQMWDEQINEKIIDLCLH